MPGDGSLRSPADAAGRVHPRRAELSPSVRRHRGGEPSIPECFHAAASRLIDELEGFRSPEGVVRCLLRAYDRVRASAAELPADQVVARAEAMARGLLTVGSAAARRLAS